MLVDEDVDRLLIGRVDPLELQSHSDATIAPRDARVGLDVQLRTWQSKSYANLCVLIERAHRANRHAAFAEVQS